MHILFFSYVHVFIKKKKKEAFDSAHQILNGKITEVIIFMSFNKNVGV